MTRLKSYSGCHHPNLKEDINIYGRADSKVWGNGFSERTSFRDRMQEKMDRLILCYFAMVIRGRGR